MTLFFLYVCLFFVRTNESPSRFARCWFKRLTCVIFSHWQAAKTRGWTCHKLRLTPCLQRVSERGGKRGIYFVWKLCISAKVTNNTPQPHLKNWSIIKVFHNDWSKTVQTREMCFFYCPTAELEEEISTGLIKVAKLNQASLEQHAGNHQTQGFFIIYVKQHQTARQQSCGALMHAVYSWILPDNSQSGNMYGHLLASFSLQCSHSDRQIRN